MFMEEVCASHAKKRFSKHSEPDTAHYARLPAAEYFVESFSVAFEVLQYFDRRKRGFDALDKARLLRRCVGAVGDAVQAAQQFLTAFGEHEVDKQASGIRVRRLSGNAHRVSIGENGIQIDPVHRCSG